MSVKDRAEIVVIGAGIMGLSIAYHLARLGITDIAVIDRSYLCGGASGRDGGVFPWPFVWGFAQAARKLGVEVSTFVDVVGFDTEGSRITGVRTMTAKGPHTIRTSKVVNAAGAWSPEIARLLGVELPNKPH